MPLSRLMRRKTSYDAGATLSSFACVFRGASQAHILAGRFVNTRVMRVFATSAGTVMRLFLKSILAILMTGSRSGDTTSPGRRPANAMRAKAGCQSTGTAFKSLRQSSGVIMLGWLFSRKIRGKLAPSKGLQFTHPFALQNLKNGSKARFACKGYLTDDKYLFATSGFKSPTSFIFKSDFAFKIWNLYPRRVEGRAPRLAHSVK